MGTVQVPRSCPSEVRSRALGLHLEGRSAWAGPRLAWSRGSGGLWFSGLRRISGGSTQKPRLPDAAAAILRRFLGS